MIKKGIPVEESRTLEEVLGDHYPGATSFFLISKDPEGEAYTMAIQMQQSDIVEALKELLRIIEPGARAMLVHHILLDSDAAMIFAAGVAQMIHSPEEDAPAPAPGNDEDTPS